MSVDRTVCRTCHRTISVKKMRRHEERCDGLRIIYRSKEKRKW